MPPTQPIFSTAHTGPFPAHLNEPLTSPDPLATIMLHLADFLLQKIPEHDREHTALILGTTRGCLAADIEFDRSRRADNARYASPAAFARTLPSTLTAELSVKLRLRGPQLTITAGNASAAVALGRALSWMRHLGLRHCLTGACDPGDSPDTYRAALLLLSAGESALPDFTPASVDLTAAHDVSLDHLIAWSTHRNSQVEE